jgi:hypothetical protein
LIKDMIKYQNDENEIIVWILKDFEDLGQEYKQDLSYW